MKFEILDEFDNAEQRTRFNQLASLWRRESGPSSSVTELAKHPAYQAIIQMGEDAVPLILEELKANPGHWFIALQKITGANPVSDEQRGNFQSMAEAWISWGNNSGYATN